ncbi:MAG: response regulator [Candidatus Paceibacterota bacterium]
MYKILIIEDEKLLSEMYEEKFSQSGFSVMVAHSAEEGFESLKEYKPDLILLDILLPQENGIQFLKRAKDVSEISKIPVIVFSNYDDPETKKKASDLGARDYLIKTNFTPSEIVGKIKDFLKRLDTSR